MTRHLRIKILTLITLAVSTTTLQAASQAEYDHDRFVTQPTEAVREFRAFKLSFDTDADGVALGVPDWVAYELSEPYSIFISITPCVTVCDGEPPPAVPP